MEFKVRDVVRRVSHPADGMPIGRVCVVKEVFGTLMELEGVGGWWDARYFESITPSPVEPESSCEEYEWPCIVGRATQVWNMYGREWEPFVPTNIESTALSYNHRRKKTDPRPVTVEDVGRLVEMGEKEVRLLAFGPRWCAVSPGNENVVCDTVSLRVRDEE